MYTELQNYITYTLYPALFEALDKPGVLDEFKFKRNGNKCQSSTVHKISGRDGKTKGQVYVYANNPGQLIDHSEGSTDLIEYVRQRDSLGFYEAIELLANMAGIKSYKQQLTQEELEEMRRAKQAAKTWQAAIDYCIQCIRDGQYKDKAKPEIDYLTNSRKYTGEDINAIQLGYLPNKRALLDHLKSLGFTEEEIAAIRLTDFAGATHRITIPIRNARGQAVGMAIRTAEPGREPKYIYSTGLKKGEALYNLYTKARQGRIVLVEGQLDAAITEARGYTWATVAAIGGKVISAKQIAHLLQAGAREVFICLDNEAGTEGEVKKTIEALREIEQLEDRIYIVQLPNGIKDVDQLVTTEGIEAFTEAVKKAQAYYLYYADKRIEQYNKERDEEGYTDRGLNNLTDDIQRIAAGIHNPVRREDLKDLFIRNLQAVGIQATSDAFIDAVDRIRYKTDQEKQSKAFSTLLEQAKDIHKGGKVKEAIDHVADKLREVKLRDKRTEFEQLEAIDESEEALTERIKATPDTVKTGYKMNIDGYEEDVELPAGQLTFFAAPTNHGKTLMLTNIALQIIQAYQNKEVYFFTFEMSADLIKLHFLNTYIGEDLNKGYNNNRRTIRDFYKDGKSQYIAKDKENIFNGRRSAFYSNIIPRLKVRNVEYSADEIIEYIEYIRKRTKDAVIFIDYIQKLRSDRKGKIDGRYTELKFICEDLNACADRTGLPIVLAAQFKREIATPLDMHPTGIAEASDIEKIASEIYGIWNCTKKLGRTVTNGNEIATLNSKYQLSVKDFTPEPAIILEVLKSRSIPTGAHVKLAYNGNTGVIGGKYAGVGKPQDIFEKD